MRAEHLRIGASVILADGSTATVLELDPEQHTARVRYVDSPFEPEKAGSEGVCSEDEITGSFEGEAPEHMIGTLEGEKPANVPPRR